MIDRMIRALYANFIASPGDVAGHSYDTLPDDDNTQATCSTTANTFGSYSQTAKATLPYRAVGADTPYSFSFPYPIRVPNGMRLATRAKCGDTGGRTVDVVSIHATGLQG